MIKVELRNNQLNKKLEIQLSDGNFYSYIFDERIEGKGLEREFLKKKKEKQVLVFDEVKKVKMPIEDTFLFLDEKGIITYWSSAATLLTFPNQTIHAIHPTPIFYANPAIFVKTFNLSESYESGLFTKSFVGNPIPNHYLEVSRPKDLLKKTSYLSTEGLEYTFGVEFETDRGTVAPWLYEFYDVGITCERDGSVSGGEYITSVLKGDEGFLDVYNTTKILSERCTFNSECGLHVHIGNATFNNNFTVMAYLFAIKVQDDLFEYFPYSRRENKMCSKLLVFKEIEEILNEKGYYLGCKEAYEVLFKKLSNGRELSREVNKSRPHPGGRYTDRYSRGNAKITDDLFRYKWFNLITTSFDTRDSGKKRPKKNILNNGVSHTLEFRNHHATLNFLTTSYWILICMAMTSFIENFQKDIVQEPELKIKDVIRAIYHPNKAENLCLFLDLQKIKFSKGNENIEPMSPINYFNNQSKGDIIKMLM